MIELPDLYNIVEESSHETAFNRGEVEALYLLLNVLRPKTVVEIGVEFGRSTTVFAELQKDLGYSFTAIDAWVGEYGQQAKKHVQLQMARNEWKFDLVSKDSLMASMDWVQEHDIENLETIDFLHIDGDHSYRGVSSDIRAWFPLVKMGGYIVFDDYGHNSLPEVFEAVYGHLNTENATYLGRYGNKLGVFQKIGRVLPPYEN